MKIVGAVFGFLVLAVVFVVWFRVYRSIKGDDSPLFSMGNAKPGKENDSLEEFIASYKRGEVAAGNSPPDATKPSSLAAPAATQTAPAKPDAFVSGACGAAT